VIKSFSGNPFSRITVLLLAIVFVAIKISHINSYENYFKDSNAIAFDTYGYYLHLPATIIHKDPAIENKAWLDSLNNTYQKDRPWYQAYPGEKEGRLVNVYPTGIAVCWLPFFLAGHAMAAIGNYPQDGLSYPYQLMIVLSGLFYAILGMILLRKLLLNFFNDKLTAVLLLLLGFGTNLFHYATYDNTMPHIIIFVFDTLILLLTVSWHKQPKRRTAFFIGLLIALVTICRPSEIVWILVPLFWNVDSFRALKEKIIFLREHFSHVLLLVTGMILLGSVQLFYWKYASGHWFFYNHMEGFDFLRPFTRKVLFSYKKGWLLYTPMMIFAIAGFVALYRKNKKIFFPLFLFFFFNLWVISAWECWWYGGSFGQRPFVQSYCLMAIPFGYFLESLKKKITQLIFGIVAGAFVLLNLFQVWQLVHGILDPYLMTQKYYWAIFGKTTVDASARELMEIDRNNLPLFVPAKYTERRISFSGYEDRKFLRDDEIICDTFGFQSKHSGILDQEHLYGAALKSPFDSIVTGDHARIRMFCDVFIPEGTDGNKVVFVFLMQGHRGQDYGYTAKSFQSLGAKPGEWTHIEGWFVTPEILHSHDKMIAFTWNNGAGKIFIDNMEISVFSPKE
jgi:predicted tellurium resistance membrane protein TerC